MRFLDEDKLEMAEDLLELWEAYLISSRTFPPTMTDFMHWLREQIYEAQHPEQDVNLDRTSPDSQDLPTERKDPVKPDDEPSVKSAPAVEASVAQYAGGDPLTSAVEAHIKQLYEEGYALARIRERLNLPRVSLVRIHSIATK